MINKKHAVLPFFFKLCFHNTEYSHSKSTSFHTPTSSPLLRRRGGVEGDGRYMAGRGDMMHPNVTSHPCFTSFPDTYNMIALSGAMGEGHLPCEALKEMIRIVKPG